MFYSLTGTIVHSDTNGIAVECGGVGFYCYTTLGTLGQIGGVGEKITLYTYLSVRENAMDLYGFYSSAELNCFKMLLGVSGVGSKVALSILSSLTPEQVALSIAADDYKALTAASGVGAKLAQRIILELRDKVSNTQVSAALSSGGGNMVIASGNLSEAVSALVVLGYNQGQATSVLAGLPQDTPVQDLIKLALKSLASQS